MLVILVLSVFHFFSGASSYGFCPFDHSCIKARDCINAIDLLMKGIHHSLNRCGWSGKDEMVCCPKNRFEDPDITNFRTRKSIRACNDYANEIPTSIRNHISGGEDAELGEFPHMAALGYEGDRNDDMDWARCGASLISDQYLLTAAHCIVQQDRKVPVGVRLGTIDLLGNTGKVRAVDAEIDELIVHPRYDIKNKLNDIALIRLKRTVDMTSNIRPACLYTKNDNPVGLMITGWGLTRSKGEASRILQKADVSPVDNMACNRTYSSAVIPKTIVESQICADSKDIVRKDSCSGDSGGPLQILDLRISTVHSIVGVTSYGDGCGASVPSIYTRVYSYLDWIEDTVWP